MFQFFVLQNRRTLGNSHKKFNYLTSFYRLCHDLRQEDCNFALNVSFPRI